LKKNGCKVVRGPWLGCVLRHEKEGMKKEASAGFYISHHLRSGTSESGQCKLQEECMTPSPLQVAANDQGRRFGVPRYFEKPEDHLSR